jgi:hypothetical protein
MKRQAELERAGGGALARIFSLLRASPVRAPTRDA